MIITSGEGMAIFECILTFDTIKLYLGEFYSKDLFVSNKDRNKDGKQSYWERTLPKDGGHRLKLVSLIVLFFGVNGTWIGAGTLLVSCDIHIEWWMIPISAIGMFLLYSAGFELGYAKYRKPPLGPNDFVAYDPPTLPIT